MKVKELIKILNTFDQEKRIMFYDSDEGWKDIDSIREWKFNGEPIIEIDNFSNTFEEFPK